MTCDETRDLLSAYLDEALDPDERSRVDAHLEGCAECRRELEALRGTVALLHRVDPVRAPVGFVDRVMVAARPRPWFRRVADAVLLPLSVKLPLEATAVVMIGLLAVYLFERSPELQQAAREVDRRQEAAAPAPAKEKPAELLADKAARGTAPSTPAPVEGPPADARDRADAPRSRDVDPQVVPSSPPAVAAPPPSAAPAPRYASPPPVGSAPPAAVPEGKPPAKTEAAPSENVAGAVRPESEIRQRALQTAEDSRAAAASSRLGAKKAAPPADVVARVAVKDRDAAERELAALVARLGGAVTQRRREEEATVVEAVIPQSRYAEFAESLARIGSWRVEAERPDLPAQIRVVLRLQ
jgi:Putative zinc-finger